MFGLGLCVFMRQHWVISIVVGNKGTNDPWLSGEAMHNVYGRQRKNTGEVCMNGSRDVNGAMWWL